MSAGSLPLIYLQPCFLVISAWKDNTDDNHVDVSHTSAAHIKLDDDNKILGILWLIVSAGSKSDERTV